MQRIGRALGCQRVRRLVRDRAMALTERPHAMEDAPSGVRFVSTKAAARAGQNRAHAPAGPDDGRQITAIAPAEFSAARLGQDTVEITGRIGVRRLSVPHAPD